ncbi:COG3014 family protein [Marinoscillum furvescens]|uniref:Tetratricopeptide repeat protein n=1 Tax=Marinoscillum furvescens DSM 4134 TaxID=1122208 RepID=A0A3D9KY70_MARFU|nr:hypothetical protein [Marinoscillum furvescens]RED94371.1 hypothetical protein C7460_12158 [Marinoscillum furvescens DSM 4134]
MKFLKIKYIGAVLLGAALSSCATYYQIQSEFNQNFESGQLEQAARVLDENKRAGKKKARFLYYADQGVVNAMLGNLEESNKWFEKAYLFGEDYQNNYANVAASFLVNPNTIVYPGEDHEHLLLLYYKALNFLKLNDHESALVECRRLINRLNALSDRYKSDKKYRRDAFVHNLMGIIFEASGDVSNAFVAYRNAHNIYEQDYTRLFGLETPNQLKQDLLRTAYLNGYDSDLAFFERKFDLTYQHKPNAQELVFFWHNGLGPVKDEWSINFTTVANGDGFVTFTNEEYGLSFPYNTANAEGGGDLTDLRVFRVAFPKYVERKPYFERAVLETPGKRFALEKAEDINAVAFKTLEERMLQEMGKGLLRVALKKSVEMAIRNGGESEDGEEQTKEEKQEEAMREGLSFLVGVVNAATEKADTRNWQTIPHSIYYTRVPLKTGRQTVMLKTIAPSGATQKETFLFDVGPGETVFHTFHSLEYRR